MVSDSKIVTSKFTEPRQRDLFPLSRPKTLKTCPNSKTSLNSRRRLARRTSTDELLFDGIEALNSLAHCGTAVAREPCTSAQLACMTRLRAAVRDFGGPPTFAPGSSALSELAANSATYGGGSTIAAYDEKLVSWPPLGTKAVPAEELLDGEPLILLREWKHRLLRSADECLQLRNELQLDAPYVDPVLRRDRRVYARFLKLLSERGMLEFRTNHTPIVGVLCVRKSGGRLRLISDTRVANCQWVAPAATTLPTAGSLASVELPAGATPWVAQGDVANAFYHIELPNDMGPYFTLPLIPAGLVGLTHVGIDGHELEPVGPLDLLSPCLRVLPMGWGWSLHFMQNVVSAAGRRAGLRPADEILDRRAAKPLQGSSVRHGTYVDNFMAISCVKSASRAAVEGWEKHLRASGLDTHDTTHSGDETFCGSTLR